MSELLDDPLNLEILEHICSGKGVEVNINELSQTLKRHRNTIKNQVQKLFEHDIINKPIYPFSWLYEEYPVMVIVRADFPRNKGIDEFIRKDEHIFGAFYMRDGEYNTLLIEYHKDLYTYGEWRKRIVKENLIPPRESRYPADALLFSTKQMIKHRPEDSLQQMETVYKEGGELEINGFKMNALCFEISKRLIQGEGIRTNESHLSKKLKVHRRTVERRVSSLLDEGVVSRPACRFPRFFVPPNQILVYYLVEVKKSKDRILKAMMDDSFLPMICHANVGRYNLMLFGVFSNIEDHFEWEESYDKRFPGALGAMKKVFLSPKMTAAIDQQKVSLGIIRRRKGSL